MQRYGRINENGPPRILAVWSLRCRNRGVDVPVLKNIFNSLICSERVVFKSSYDITSSQLQLKRRLNRRPTPRDRRVVVGVIHPRGSIVVRTKSFYMYNGFQPVFQGELRHVDDRVVLEGRYTLAANTKLGLLLLFLFQLSMLLWIFVSVLRGQLGLSQFVPMLTCALGLLVFGAVLVVTGNLAGRRDVLMINRFLRDALRKVDGHDEQSFLAN